MTFRHKAFQRLLLTQAPGCVAFQEGLQRALQLGLPRTDSRRGPRIQALFLQRTTQAKAELRPSSFRRTYSPVRNV